MWPFRPDRISELFDDEQLRAFLLLGDSLGSAVKFVERTSDVAYRSVDGDPSRERSRGDAFCTFFRHGLVDGKPAFAGADSACARCEEKLLRLSTDAGSAEGDITHRRCHMGLTDFIVPVNVMGRAAGALVAGRVVRAEEERQRIRKIVSRLGTLTRTEAASTRVGDAIEPANEKVRKRLHGEIAEIPLADGEAILADMKTLAGKLGALGTRQFEARRLRREAELLGRAGDWPRSAPLSRVDLSEQTSAVLSFLRVELKIEFLAFFARVPSELDGEKACLSLVAESGLDTGTRQRYLELDFSQISTDAVSGRESVSASISALRPTSHTPDGLKDRLTKSLFFAPVELRSGREGALVFGPALSTVVPEDRDFAFLADTAVATTRRYYSLALEVDRAHVQGQLETRESRVGELREAVKDLKVSEKEARETRGFSNFDICKLVHKCVARATKLASEQGVDLDDRTVPERLPLHGHRRLLGDAVMRLIELGVGSSTNIDKESARSPLRVIVKRTQKGFWIGVESIGEFLKPESRRKLLARPGRGNDRRTKKSVDSSGGVSTDLDVGIIYRAARRHHGRFRVESERLRRFESNPKRWLGKTTFVLELPDSLIRTVVKAEPGAPPSSEGQGSKKASRRKSSPPRGADS